MAKRTEKLIKESERGDAGSLLQRDGWVLGIFLALTLIMTNPLALHLASAVEDTHDALLNTWIMAWVGHALIFDPVQLFDANIFYPLPRTLAFSEALLTQGLLALPVNLASGNNILGYNLVLLFSFFLAAYGMYLFVFDLTKQRGAAVVAGTVFAFNPYNLGNLAQVQLLSLGWLPLALLFERRIFSHRVLRGSTRIRDSILLALFFALQALSSFYYALLAAMTVSLCALWSLFILRWENRRSSRVMLIPIAQLALAGVLVGLLLFPILQPYLQVQREEGFARNLDENERFSANLKQFIEVSPQNLVYGSFLAPRPAVTAGCYPLDNLFPGIVPVVLAIIGVAAAKNRGKWFYLFLFVFAFLLALGPRLFVAPSLATDITMPYRWLYDAFPLAHALRAPVRFDGLVMLALAVLAGVGVATRSLGRPQIVLAVSLIMLEYLALPAANVTPVPTGDAIPQYARWLAEKPPGTILELPLIGSKQDCPADLTSQYLSTYHWQDTPDGFSGFFPPVHGEFAYEIETFPDERSISLLQALGVNYVVVHSKRMPEWNAAIAGQISSLEPVIQFQDDYIYEVAPRAQDPTALTPSLYLAASTAPGQNTDAYIIVRNRVGAPPFGVRPGDTLSIEARWSDGTVQNTAANMPLVTGSVSVVPIRLVAPRQSGDYTLNLGAQGEAIGMWQLSGVVPVRTQEPSRDVVLPASVALSSSLKPVYAPGEEIPVDLIWLVGNKINAYYSASVRIANSKGDKVVAQDREPIVKTLLWRPGSSVPDHFSPRLPSSMAPGEYTLQVMLYQGNQGYSALLLDQADTPREVIVLGRFVVR